MPTEDLTVRLRDAIELLESVAQDRLLLAGLEPQERSRLITAAGDVFCPDVDERRRRTKEQRRRTKADKIRRDEAVLATTGIRSLRAKPVFVTPDVYAPAIEPDDVGNEFGDRTAGEDISEPPGGRGDTASAAETASTKTGAGETRTVGEERHCYVCKKHYSRVDDFYDQLCPPCAELNAFKRTETADLTGRVALLTGGRVKIGYQAGIKMLRAGAELIVTTRFPHDAAQRYAAEVDFADWGHRLEIYGLDLRHTPSVEALCQHLATTRDRLDFVINNACQTVRRPPDFYRHMMEAELAALPAMPEETRALLGGLDGLRGPDLVAEPSQLVRAVGIGELPNSALLSQAELLEDDRPQGHLFPAGRLDQDLQQVDLRDRNSWRLTLAEVSTVELLETQLVNAVAPFVLNARLKPLMTRTPERDKHIVNVSAVEGQFYRRLKTTRHPHTNMAKAALNMMTRTSAADYHADGIHMNSVDTGWVSDEDPAAIAERKTAEHRFHPPLDIVDGAARIVDPIIAGFNSGEHQWGKFLKDYRPTDW